MTLHAETHGREDAPALVLLHPIATSSAIWSLQIPQLARELRVVTIDLPGHGRSGALAADGFAAWADAVAATLDALHVVSATVVGLSLGGMVGQALAIRHPHRVERLLLACCGARTMPPVRELWSQRLAETDAGGMESQVAPTLARWLTPAFAERSPLAMRWVADMIRATTASGYAAAVRSIQQLDHLEALRSLTMPIRVIAGQHDAAVPAPAVNAMAEASRADVVTLDASHLANVEAAQAFTEAIAAFAREGLAETSRSAPGTHG